MPRGRSGSINSIAFSRDSTQLISASHDRTVRIWDTSDGAYLQTLDDSHSEIVSLVAFSHDSPRFASASCHRTVNVYSKLATTVDRLAFAIARESPFWRRALGASKPGASSRIAQAAGSRPGRGSVRSTGSSGSGTGRRRVWITWIADHYTKLHTGPFILTWDYITPIALSTSNEPQFDGVALSSSVEWITYNSKNLIWLPPEYRLSCSAVSRGMIGIGVGSGEVWLFNVEANDMLSKVLSFS